MSEGSKKISKREFVKYGLLGIGGAAVSTSNINLIAKNISNMDINAATEKMTKWTKEAYHYINMPNAVRCMLCPDQCVIRPNDKSICHTRTNINNKLYTTAYGNPCIVNVDPIEKKPLFHFQPGSRSFSIAAPGCNFRCEFCQNWQISQMALETSQLEGEALDPGQIVQSAVQSKCKSIAYTYTEPTIFMEL